MAEYTQTYWNELIDKYRNGTISDRDRFQLEKQALDDPFLFDALEGYALHDEPQQDTKDDKKTTKIFTLSRIAVAASIVFLVAVMFNLNSNKRTQLESDNAIAMVLDETEEDANPEMKNEEETASDATVSSTSKSNEKPESSLPSKDVTPNTATEKNKAIKNNPPSRVSTPIATEPTQDYAKAEKEEIDQVEIASGESADVINEQAGAMAATSNEPAIEEQSIDLPSKESIDIVNAANFDNGVQKNNVGALSEDSELVTNKPEAVAKKRKGVSLYYEAVPVIGKEIFDDFAKGKIDERGLRQEKPQEVTIEFTIDKNGNLSDFHHIFSGCPECGPYAISLLQKSGEWKTVPPGFSGKARYTFIF